MGVCGGGGERMGWRARLGVTLGLSAEHAKCRLLLLRLASSLACWPSRRLPVPLPLRLLQRLVFLHLHLHLRHLLHCCLHLVVDEVNGLLWRHLGVGKRTTNSLLCIVLHQLEVPAGPLVWHWHGTLPPPPPSVLHLCVCRRNAGTQAGGGTLTHGGDNVSTGEWLRGVWWHSHCQCCSTTSAS